ncbi:hypothetical protein LTR08_002178 [Meristemomyces frigidus]|nr:hypothetical protein LTR08_002178 [Meristemomyces frigidus]
MSRPNPQPAPVSFKTVPGRQPTQKWQQASRQNYDGDDWGGYDPYDEYGGGYEEAEEQPQTAQASAKPQRQNSFDADDEKREFNSANYDGEARGVSPAVVSNTDSAGGTANFDPNASPRGRNFTNPEQVPMPLALRASPARSTNDPAAFPPRKSSIVSQASTSSASGVSMTSAQAKNIDKPLPFIRPSDIYRRMAEDQERERRSVEEGRGSMDSVGHKATNPLLPPVSRVSGFGSDFLHGMPDSSASSSDSGAGTAGSAMAPPVSRHVQSTLARVFGAPVENPDPSHVSATARALQHVAPVTSPTTDLSRGGEMGLDGAPWRGGFEPAAGDVRGRYVAPAEATRAPPGRDPAAEMLAERRYGGPMEATRAPQGSDPAAGILAERQHGVPTEATRAPQGYDPAGDILAERVHERPVHAVGQQHRRDSSEDSWERQGGTPLEATRAPQGHDPAADILAERQHGMPTEATRAPPGRDPAAEFLAERQHATPVDAVGQQSQTPHLQHQPSSGFRSVVHTAFDRKDDSSAPPTPVSRDGSHNGSGVSRSDTTSTAGISPIMSRVPSAATAQQRQRSRDPQVPPIAEEPASARTPTQSRPASDQLLANASPSPSPMQQMARKPSPSHSRHASAESAAGMPGRFQPGYRRSLDPPSQENSPARTPGLEEGAGRRVSGPMVAETVDGSSADAEAEAEASGVPDQAAEVPTAELAPVETSPTLPVAMPVVTGRGRSGTDYSTREADLASAVGLSPTQQLSHSPPVAEDQKATQQLFLRTHRASTPTSPGSLRPVSPGLAARGAEIARATTPGSVGGGGGGRDSPVRGSRVRQIAGRFDEIEGASRRNSAVSVGSSKSSWSNYGGRSEENLGLRRKGTGGSLLAGDGVGEVEGGGELEGGELGMGGGSLAVPGLARPGVESLGSFRPHLPGEWVSYAPTPVGESPPLLAREGSPVRGEEPSARYESPSAPPPAQQHEARGYLDEDVASSPLTPRASAPAPSSSRDEPVDLTPTTRKRALRENGEFAPEAPSALAQVRGAGAALGASLIAMGGSVASQARDFGSAEPAREVEVLGLRGKVPYGDVNASGGGGVRPGLGGREESEMTDVTAVSRGGSDSGGGSVGSDVPPTVPDKDTSAPEEGVASGGHDNLGVAAMGGRPVSSYFSGVVPPLRTGHSRAGSAEPRVLALGEERPQVLPRLSTDTGAGDLESDRLRKEIVRSLNPLRGREEGGVQRESILETEEEGSGGDEVGGTLAGRGGEHALLSPEGCGSAEPERPAPRMLDQRFSWEDLAQQQQQQQGGVLPAPEVREPESPQIMPEAPYERAHSAVLHIVNPTDGEEALVEEQGARHLLPAAVAVRGLVSPLTASQENVALPLAGRVDGEIASSPVSGYEGSLLGGSGYEESLLAGSGSRPPSYYQHDHAPDGDAAILQSRGKGVPPPAPASSSPTAPERLSGQQQHQSQQRIPPFREILAIKSSPERIRAYNDTRRSFAEMDTGLAGWLGGMLTLHPELAALSTSQEYPPPAAGGGTFAAGRHKHSPSIVTKLYGGERKTSGPSGNGGEASATTSTPGRELRRGEGLDMEKVQQRGKELMKGASVLGGKAGAGAKGLFAKGRSRWGGKRESGGEGGKTPSSSGPRLRNTLSRLRERSRSKSRPGGLVTASPELGEESGDGGGLRSGWVDGGERRKEAWEEDDDALSTAVGQEEGGTPARLGVLPSPAVETFSYLERSPGKGAVQGEGTVVEDRDAEVDAAEDVDLPQRPREKEAHRAEPPDVMDQAAEIPVASMELVGTPAGELEQQLSSVAEDGYGRVGVESETRQSTLQRPNINASASGSAAIPAAEGTSANLADYAGPPATSSAERSPSASAVATPVRSGRPEHSRQVSALASLPSVRRNLTLSRPQSSSGPPGTPSRTPGTPSRTPPPFGLSSQPFGDEDGPYASTPTATSARRSALRQIDDEEDMYESTPVVSRAPVFWRTSAIGTASGLQGVASQTGSGAERGEPEIEWKSTHPTATEWDRLSEVSAEEHAGTADEDRASHEHRTAASLRSSVSSFGSPEIVVVKRASMLRLQPAQGPATPPASDRSTLMARTVFTSPSSSRLRLDQAEYLSKEAVAPSTTPGAQQPPQTSVQPSVTAPGQQGLVDRDREPFAEHLMSYTPLGQGSSGAPTQEALSAGNASESEPVDISGFGGPPVGTLSFQQHPAFRNLGVAAPPTEYEDLRAPRSGTATPATLHSRQVSGDTADKTKNRFSGFFRGPEPSLERTTSGPPPNAITPFYGLEGLDTTGAEAMSAVPLTLRQQDDKQKKRRSSLWDTFKRSPSTSKTSLSRANSIAPLESRTHLASNPAVIAANAARENTAKPATLQKLQKPRRTASTASLASPAASPAEPKKKPRFSRLGSLFGRSNTLGHGAERPNKLTKSQPPARENVQGQGLAPSKSVRGYEAYEAMRRQQMPSSLRQATNATYVDTSMSSPYQSATQETAVQNSNTPEGPPPQGWYGLSEDQPASEQMRAPQYQPEPPPTSQRPAQARRLHSDGLQQRGLQQASIPEAFRPTEASYGRPPPAIGPPPEHQPPVVYEPPAATRMPTLPTRQPYWDQPRSVSGPLSSVEPARQWEKHAEPAAYQPAHQAPAPPTAANIQWTRETPLPLISSVQPNKAPAESSSFHYDQRMDSRDREVERSPAREYPTQQTPWSVNMPDDRDAKQRTSRTPSWSVPAASPPPRANMYVDQRSYSGQQAYSGQHAYSDQQTYPSTTSPPPSNARYSAYDLPMSPQSPAAQQPQYYSPPRSSMPSIDQGPMYGVPFVQDKAPARGGSYPTPPYTPQSPSKHHQPLYGVPMVQSPSGQPTQHLQQRPPQVQRYYSQRQQQSSSRPADRPLTYQRTPSGFSGRRDDAAVSEQELETMMRGTSYPGQEWEPRI